jgi:hypothetical protein
MKFSFLFIALLLQPLAAQDISEKEKPFPFAAERSVKVVCLAADSGISSVWVRTLVKNEAGAKGAISTASTPVPFSKRSSPVSYVGPAKIEFFKTEPPPGSVFDEEGNRKGPAPFATTTLPSGKREILLLFVPLSLDQRKDGLEYRLLPFDDSMEALPWGSYRFINFTNRSLVTYAGSKNQRHEIKSNRASSTISPGGSKRNILWLIYDNPQTKGKPIFSAQWLHRPNYRSLIFITESTNQRGAINVKSIDEWQD